MKNRPGSEEMKSGLMRNNRHERRHADASDRMQDEARELGANAVINVCFTTSMVMQGAAELLVTGTAVVIDKEIEGV